MPEYSSEYSKRKMTAVKAMVEEIKVIEQLKKEGGKELLKKHGYRGNQPKMALRGLRSFLVSEDDLFADLLEKYESGKVSPYKLAEAVRQRTEKIGASEVIVHSDTIHHANPLELADAFDEMEPQELADFLTEEYEVKGETYGDTRQNTRGQSYTTRGHLAQTTNPRGRYKATNEFSEPGLRETSAHPRGANDPLMKAPEIKPTTRAEAKEFISTKTDIVQESRALGAFADRDVRALVDKKMQDRGIILPGDTVYRSDLPDETLKAVRESLDNPVDEIELAKAFKTPPRVKIVNGVARIITGGGAALTVLGVVSDAGEAKAGVEQIVKGKSITDKLAGGMKVASGVTGLASVGVPVLALPSLLLRQGAALTQYKVEEGAMPKSKVSELLPTPKAVMANTPTGVATLTKPESDYERRRRARTGR